MRIRHGDRLAVYGVVAPDVPIVDLERFPLLVDAEGAFATAYDPAPASLYLVRPDGHIGYRADHIAADRLTAHLQPIFGDG